MLRFKQFLSEAKTSLQHIAGDARGNNGFSHAQLSTLLEPGKIDFHATEKTDGAAAEIGHHPEHGFFFRYSGSGVGNYPNHPDRHAERAQQRSTERGGRPFDDEKKKIVAGFAAAHKALAGHKGITNLLKQQSKKTGQVAVIKGEVFPTAHAKPSEDHPGHVRWQGTSYHPEITGKVAGFVVHSKLPENEWLNGHHDKIEAMSTPDIAIHHDMINHQVPNLDMSDLKARLKRVDPKKVKGEHKDEFESIKSETASRISDHWNKHAPPPKWGPETEGYVMHGEVRYKVTSAKQKAKMAKQMGVK